MDFNVGILQVEDLCSPARADFVPCFCPSLCLVTAVAHEVILSYVLFWWVMRYSNRVETVPSHPSKNTSPHLLSTLSTPNTVLMHEFSKRK